MTQLLETTLAFLRSHGMEIEADMMERQHQLQTELDLFDAAIAGAGSFPQIASDCEAWTPRRFPAEHSAEEIADRLADYDIGEMRLRAAERADDEGDW